MKATVIIPTYSRSAYLKDTIECLQKQSIPVTDFEILVVDNSADGKFRDVVKGIHALNLRYVWEQRPGAHRARNTGAVEARGEIVIFIDDDEIFDHDLVRYHLDAYKDPKIGCAGGRMLPKFEADLPDYFSIFNPGDTTHLDLGGFPRVLKSTEEVWGGNMSARRSLYIKVGGMNPDIFPDPLMWLTGDGEGGLQRKIREAGYMIFYEPRACVYNRINASRLTPEFLIGRRTYRALSMSFTNIRQLKSRSFFVLQVIRHAAHCYVNYVYYSFFKGFSTSLERKLESLFWAVRGRHHLWAALNKKYRNYILQDSYL